MAEQEAVHINHGIRWSVLWELPYWDPTRQLVVDSMHCLLEGLVQHHSREVLGLTDAAAAAPTPLEPAFSHDFATHAADEPTSKHIARIHKLLTAPIHYHSSENPVEALKEKLRNSSLKALKLVCHGELGVPVTAPSGQRLVRADFAAALVAWVCCLVPSPTSSSTDIAIQRMTKPLVPANPQSLKIGMPAVIKCIREVIKNTSTPSWLHSVPYNFGASQAGTLSADEWRSMANVYLPLAFVKLWGDAPATHSQDTDDFQYVLDHSMALFSAVRLACSRTMTYERREAYRANMIRYVSGLSSDLYNTSDPRPNHHMALHIYDFLKLFGPVRGWWCFPFERLIGLLQRLPTSHKFGKSLS